jgi:hypothetical protein
MVLIGPPQFACTTLVKEGYATTKKREKHNFDVDDLMNVFNSLWTEGGSIFIHEVMRIRITFLLLAYCFSGTRIRAFLYNGKAEVKGENGQIDRLVFKGLTWKVGRYHYRRDAASKGLTTSQDAHVYLFPLRDGTTEVIVKLV